MAATYEELRLRLEKELERLNHQLEQLKATAPSPGEISEGSPFGKREEEATETFELEKRLALEKHFRSLIDEVEYALGKLKNGTYGKCEICGQSIEPARLEILPQATLCLNCKTRRTKSAKGKFAA